MGGIGMLDHVGPDERALAVEGIVRPGAAAGSSLGTSKTHASSEHDAVAAAISAATADSIARAEKRALESRTSTTLAALAQAYGRGDNAVRVGREAIELALSDARIPASRDTAAAAAAVRMAADVLVANDDTEYAYEKLSSGATTPRLRLTLAAVAAAMGRAEEAAKALNDVELDAAHALRGYLAACGSKWAEAVRHLRLAVKHNPHDVDSLLNLSISLWWLGSARKATRVALQATRLAPGRRDVSLHYLALLLDQHDAGKAADELRGLRARGVTDDPGLIVVQARIELLRGNRRRAMTLLARAAERAGAVGDESTRVEVLSNLAYMRYEDGHVPRADVVRDLLALVNENPSSEVAILKYAQAAQRRSESGPIREALSRIPNLGPAQAAYLRTQLAVLEGDAHAAATYAEEWLRLEPKNAGAATAAIVSIGIGEERWADAAILADDAVRRFPDDRAIVNNSAYVLAMAGRASDAIQLIENFGDRDFVLTATLGLAYLANGDIRTGTRLYRQAADEAERVDPVGRSLMTAYQAIVVRQLELDSDEHCELQASLLAPVTLPDDWRDRPDFIRMERQFAEHGYPWPPTPDLL